ncbi:MAG TPA: hypothetical protein VH142_03240 [Polyangiaceae bacterium]|nr:hypothetical protein [Polyangiaceae bacterium]
MFGTLPPPSPLRIEHRDGRPRPPVRLEGARELRDLAPVAGPSSALQGVDEGPTYRVGTVGRELLDELLCPGAQGCAEGLIPPPARRLRPATSGHGERRRRSPFVGERAFTVAGTIANRA